jgi:cytochrome c biogenesis protein CcdA
MLNPWPFRSALIKAIFVASVGIMLAAALCGLVIALFEGEFTTTSIAALTVGLGALLIIAGLVLTDLVNRKFHPESGMFSWSDVDALRALAQSADSSEVRAWARSLADRIAVVLPGRASRS